MDIEVIIKQRQEDGKMLLKGHRFQEVEPNREFLKQVRTLLLQYGITDTMIPSRWIFSAEDEDYGSDYPAIYGIMHQNENKTVQVILLTDTLGIHELLTH
jgi:hypothetical protein